MGITKLLGGSDPEDDPPDESTYWCTVCGMTFELSSSGIDYSWCTRCGAEAVHRVPWPTTE